MKRFTLGLIGLALLAGCGVKSGLERPDPMWNRDEAMAREREELARQQEVANRRAGHPTSTTTATAPAPLPPPTHADTTQGDPNALPQP